MQVSHKWRNLYLFIEVIRSGSDAQLKTATLYNSPRCVPIRENRAKELGVLMSDDGSFLHHTQARANACPHGFWGRSRHETKPLLLPWKNLAISRLDPSSSQLWNPHKAGDTSARGAVTHLAGWIASSGSGSSYSTSWWEGGWGKCPFTHGW